MKLKDVISLSEAIRIAKERGVHINNLTLRDRVKKGMIRSTRVGTYILFDRNDMDKIIKVAADTDFRKK